MESVELLEGSFFEDQRGKLSFNNDFDYSKIKRIYFIENASTEVVRAWQGHKIESRWFLAVKGSFEIKVIEILDWENPKANFKIDSFVLNDNSNDVLAIPKGFITSIRAIDNGSKLMAMSDYGFNEVSDEYKFDKEFFENN